MKKINYKSDFDFILRLRDCNGNEIGWPDYDWKAEFWTTQKVNAYVASCVNGVAVNCFNDNGKIHIVMDNHHLGAGTLNIEFIPLIPNDIYPDGSGRINIPVESDIQLIRCAAPCPESFEVEMMIPYIGKTIVLGRIELETNASVYTLPICGEYAERHDPPIPGYGYYDYYAFGNEYDGIGIWDI